MQRAWCGAGFGPVGVRSDDVTVTMAAAGHRADRRALGLLRAGSDSCCAVGRGVNACCSDSEPDPAPAPCRGGGGPCRCGLGENARRRPDDAVSRPSPSADAPWLICAHLGHDRNAQAGLSSAPGSITAAKCPDTPRCLPRPRDVSVRAPFVSGARAPDLSLTCPRCSMAGAFWPIIAPEAWSRHRPDIVSLARLRRCAA